MNDDNYCVEMTWSDGKETYGTHQTNTRELAAAVHAALHATKDRDYPVRVWVGQYQNRGPVPTSYPVEPNDPAAE